MRDSSSGGGSNKLNEFTLVDSLKIVGVVFGLCIILFFAGKLNQASNRDECIGKYATPTCFELKAKEARVKEEYRLKLEEIENERARR